MTTTDKAINVTHSVTGRSIIPFTGPLFAMWAFFDPEGFGRWFGTMIHAIRVAAGL
jgi:hypothetical protein